jgi:Zn-dependent peptidase ImmA (M78 family)
LIDLSKVCKRQIAFFFLPDIPPKTKKPTDFRNLEPELAELSDKTLLAFRRAKRYQDFLIQMNGPEYYHDKYSWLSKFHKSFTSQIDSDESTNWIRNLIDYPVNEQMTANIDSEASYRRWRNNVEHKLGIHIFQFAMPKDEVQGFSYSDSFPYCITVNNAYPATSRTFTLFHEFSHILKSQSGLCKPDDTVLRRQDTSTEYDCNSFAGSLLVPAKEVVPAKDKDTIFKYAKKFKVSSEVYLRRLFALDYVSENEFFQLLDDIHKGVLPTRPHYSKSPVNKSINSRGVALFNSVLDAMNQKKVSYSLASDILGLKINYLSGLQR